MEYSTIITILQLILPVFAGLGGSVITFRLMSNKVKADANKANAEASSVLVGTSIEVVETLNKLVHEHAEQIKKLTKQVKDLQEQEGLHNKERESLARKIEKLKEENLRLRILDTKKSTQINNLEKEILKLQSQLRDYANTN